MTISTVGIASAVLVPAPDCTTTQNLRLVDLKGVEIVINVNVNERRLLRKVLSEEWLNHA